MPDREQSGVFNGNVAEPPQSRPDATTLIKLADDKGFHAVGRDAAFQSGLFYIRNLVSFFPDGQIAHGRFGKSDFIFNHFTVPFRLDLTPFGSMPGRFLLSKSVKTA